MFKRVYKYIYTKSHILVLILEHFKFGFIMSKVYEYKNKKVEVEHCLSVNKAF